MVITLFKKVDIKEIKGIKERLETELKDNNLPCQRGEEVSSLIYYINVWLETLSRSNKRRKLLERLSRKKKG